MRDYEQELQQSQQFLTKHDDFLIVSHVQPDGDAVSSTLVVGWLLSCLGKKYVMVNEGAVPSRMLDLEHASDIINLSVAPLDRKFSYVICVDCADFARIGTVKHYLNEDVKILNIDHHATNDSYGAVNYIVPDAAATAEILFGLVTYMKLQLTTPVATALYTGLLTDTGGFRYSNTTPKVMQIASELLKYDVDGPGICQRLLEEMSLAQMKLLTRALNNLFMSEDGKISWLIVNEQDLAATGAVYEDLEGLVNYPRNIQGVEVGLLFKVINENAVKVSMRSAGLVDVAAVAHHFGGGGHVRAAGVKMQGNVNDIINLIIEQVKSKL